MKIFWNYIFFSTWKVLTAISKRFIEKPIDYLIFLIPYYRNHKNRKEIEKLNSHLMHGKIIGVNITYAFYMLLTTTSVFFGVLAFYIIYFFNFNFEDKVVSYFSLSIVFLLSYLINEYLISWSKSGYIEYFKIFEKNRNKARELFVVFLFHIGILSFAILSVYFTIFHK